MQVSQEIVNDYFDNLEVFIEDGITAEHIYNYDETNLSDDPGTKKCIFQRSVKYPERIMDSSKSSMSVLHFGLWESLSTICCVQC